MRTLKIGALAILTCAIAGFAIAQNADPNSAGPTKNDYRLRVLEPAEGAVITGSDLQIAVNTDIPAERDTRRDASSMPQPNVDVFIDNTLRDTIKGDSGMNVVRVSNLPPGPHKIVLLARNRSGEIVDRKEMNVSLVAAAPPVAKMARVEPPPPAAPAYVPPAPPEASPAAPVEPVTELPKTGTNRPVLVVAGIVLLLGALTLRRLRTPF